MGIQDQFNEKAEQLKQQGKQGAQRMKDEAQQRTQRKGKQQQPQRNRPMGRDMDDTMRDAQDRMNRDYDA
ncbi:hypothetical protein ACFPM3_21860 [Streptomyces coeruleoprunus]|uniref:Antitoxin n=1 Tax=Streptomyces coeruleoprunus TaxID=285563 RepID=A0ABV9XKU5_9ACTN